jgi:hypothetical protein
MSMPYPSGLVINPVMRSAAFSYGLGVSYGFLSFDYGSIPFSGGLGNGHLVSVGIIF